jgi:hypothetical protein
MKVIIQILFTIAVFAPAAQAKELIGRIPVIRMRVEAKALESYVSAWNGTGGNNSRDILNHFANGVTLAFRDPLSKGVLKDKAALKDYLDRLYARFPKQKWGIDAKAYPSLQTPGEWAVYNKFELYDRVTDEKPSVTGTGMDLFRFANDGSGRIVVDEVHLIVDGLDLSDLFKFY